jgi:hypothetical protein
MIRNFILEVRNIKKCPGGFSCNLSANGRKVAYVAPDIFEWTSHRIMVDVLEFYGSRLNLKNTGPVELEADWMEKEGPSEKKLDMQEIAKSRLREWIDAYVKHYLLAKKIKERCKETILVGSRCDSYMTIIDYYSSPKNLSITGYKHSLKVDFSKDLVLFNEMDFDDIMNWIPVCAKVLSE